MQISVRQVAVIGILVMMFAVGGCQIGDINEYSNEWLYPDDVETVYVEMFDSRSFRRGYEYVLTDSVCKRLESETPYKIVSDRDKADTLLSGQMSVFSGVLAQDRYAGVPLEVETIVSVSVSWKNLKTGKLLINNQNVTASATYSSQLGQSFDYAAGVAVNKASQRVVELMEIAW